MHQNEKGWERWNRRYEEEKAKGTQNILALLHGEGMGRQEEVVKKLYEVEISAYPIKYEIEAESEDEALQMAKDKWHDATNGRSIYESSVTQV